VSKRLLLAIVASLLAPLAAAQQTTCKSKAIRIIAAQAPSF
jgi:hypothetical protein